MCKSVKLNLNNVSINYHVGLCHRLAYQRLVRRERGDGVQSSHDNYVYPVIQSITVKIDGHSEIMVFCLHGVNN